MMPPWRARSPAGQEPAPQSREPDRPAPDQAGASVEVHRDRDQVDRGKGEFDVWRAKRYDRVTHVLTAEAADELAHKIQSDYDPAAQP